MGTAGIEAVGKKYKVMHHTGYVQLELSVVADNTRVISMYQRAGFVEYGRNPKGFYSRTAGFQEVVSMR